MFNFLPHAVDGDLNSVEQGELFYGLIKFIKAKTIVEIGVDFGSTTRYLCQAAREVDGKVYGYDGWGDYGPNLSWHHAGSKETVESLLKANGFDNFELTKIDTFDPEFKKLITTRHPVIDFAFIDGDHSYDGIKSDFNVVFPLLSQHGIIVFHDTLCVDGCREFIVDLRTRHEVGYNDGTFDLIELPFGNRDRRVGITILVKRSFAVIDRKIDAWCGSNSTEEEIYKKEKKWYSEQVNNHALYFGKSISDKSIK